LSTHEAELTEHFTGRAVRADARRNEDAILEAAKQVFAVSGIDATVREIAAKAGVGMGTLYRRFPTRSDLIAGVFRREVDACAAAAATLSSEHDPGEAVVLWLERYWQFLTTKRGLAAALHSGDPAFDALPAYFRASFEPALASLLHDAVSADQIRGDVRAWMVLRAVSALAGAADEADPEEAHVMLALMTDGMRCRLSRAEVRS
jgi:AcrR family transcriptional regulator